VDARSIEEAGRELGLGCWEAFADAELAFVAGALAVLFGSRAALALAIAAFAFALALVAAARRYLLVERLALDPDAYVIGAVRRYGCRLTSRRKRERLSRSLRSLVAEPWFGPLRAGLRGADPGTRRAAARVRLASGGYSSSTSTGHARTSRG
jgi:hypothetical protein